MLTVGKLVEPGLGPDNRLYQLRVGFCFGWRKLNLRVDLSALAVHGISIGRLLFLVSSSMIWILPADTVTCSNTPKHVFNRSLIGVEFLSDLRLDETFDLWRRNPPDRASFVFFARATRC